MYAFLIYVAATLFFAPGSPTACPTGLSNCTCQSNSVSCSQRGYTVLPEDLAFDLGMTYFYFDKNNLVEINANHFKNFIDMTHLSLMENKLKSLAEKTFYYNSKMVSIDLSKNQLTTLPTALFQRMTNLKNIYLSNNQLLRIESAHFMHLTTLVDVRLNNNNLSFVGKDAFRNSPKLAHLYLETNKLQVPEKDWFIMFNNLSKNYEVWLDDNEWSCDCRMRDFYLWGTHHPWFMHHDGEGVSVPQCKYPLRLRGTNLAQVPSVDDLRCQKAVLTSQPDEKLETKTTEGQHVQMSCNATGFPEPDVQVKNADGKVMSSSKGSTIYHIRSVATQDAGTYTCSASGYSESGVPIIVAHEMRLTVYKTPGSVATIVILSLVCLIIGLAVGVWAYNSKCGNRSVYKRLDGNPIHYESKDVAAAARANFESRHIPPGGPPAPTQVTNPYHDETESADEDDRVLEFSKDTEFLV